MKPLMRTQHSSFLDTGSVLPVRDRIFETKATDSPCAKVHENAERFTATAAVTNFTDEAYMVNSSLTAASGYAQVVYAPPRQWFLEMSFTF